MRKLWKKGMALALAAVMSVSLAACGKGDSASVENGEKGDQTGYVYVPEFVTIKEEENRNMYNPEFIGDRLYYTSQAYDPEKMESISNIGYREVSAPDVEQLMEIPKFELQEEGYSSDMSNFTFDNAGNIYALYSIYPIYVEGEEYNYNDQTMYLCKYDKDMNQVYARDLKDVFDEQSRYIQYLAADTEGNVFGSSENKIHMFDGEGVFKKTFTISTDWISGMFITEDGKVLATYYGMSGVEMAELDKATGNVKATYKDFPDMNGKLKDGGAGKLLISGSSKLYEYDMATQKAEVLLDWLQCNIDGNSIQDFGFLKDGRIAVYVDDYSGTQEMAVLTKTESSKVAKKEIITFGTLYEGDSNLQRAIVDFNKANPQYQVQLKSYIDNTAEWTEDTYTDALARFQADLVSKDSPDLIDLNSVNWENLIAKDALEDLTPYMENSTIARKEDFVASVLEAYNVDGKQLTIPKNFMIDTMMAKRSVVGDEPGWTLQEVMELAKQHPDVELMQYCDKMTALSLCLQYSSASFVDYEKGTCSFDSPEFMQVLEFANSFPNDVEWGDTSLPTLVQQGKVLLSQVSFSDIQQYQMYHLMYEGDGICMGYPTADGTPGVFLQGYDMYGISAQSEHKEGAWKFIESTLVDERHRWNFPTRKDALEAAFEEAMEIEYRYDENGEIMKDEEGNPLQRPKTTWGYNDWEAEIYAATQEEVDALKDMIAMAKRSAGSDMTIIQMIFEDVEPFFAGQKSAQEVAKIIQSRIEIFISENN